MPRVSVLLSSLNHGKFVAEAIQSVLDQTFQDFELIIVDDCSEDNSWEIIQSFNDPRIHAFRNPKRCRGAAGLNESILARARGEYIAIHHSDDAFLPDKLELQVAYLDAHPEIGATFTQVQLIDESGAPFAEEGHLYLHVFEQPNRSRHEWLNHFFFHGNALCHPSVLIRKECFLDVGVYDRRLGQITDFEMWVRLCMKHNIHILEKPLTRFRVRANEMNQSGNKPETHIRIYLEYQQVLLNYLAISSEAELFAIFPDMREMAISGHNHIPFLLARYAIERGKHFHQAFGFNKLYEMMRDPVTARELEELYGFSYPDFIRLTGSKDVYRLIELASQTETVVVLQREVERIKSSGSWRITKPFRLIWNMWSHFLRR